MKRFQFAIYLVFALITSSSYSQDALLMEFDTKSTILKGNLGENLPITISLNVEETSPFDLYVYSVKGWYWYDKYQKKIPLVGIYAGDLHLYVSKSAGFNDSILHFKTEETSPWDALDEIMARTNYDELFAMREEENAVDGTWKSKGKELAVYINSGSISFYDHFTFLQLGKSVHVNLSEIGIGEENLSIYAQKQVGAEKHVLLTYDSPASGMISGRCGGGREKGFILLRIDQAGLAQEVTYFETESCNMSIWPNEEIKKSGSVEEITVYYSDETTAIIRVDKVMTTISKQKVN